MLDDLGDEYIVFFLGILFIQYAVRLVAESDTAEKMGGA